MSPSASFTSSKCWLSFGWKAALSVLVVLLLVGIAVQQQRIEQQQREIHELRSRLARLEAIYAVPKTNHMARDKEWRLPTYQATPVSSPQNDHLRFPIEVERAMMGEARMRSREAERAINRLFQRDL